MQGPVGQPVVLSTQAYLSCLSFSRFQASLIQDWFLPEVKDIKTIYGCSFVVCATSPLDSILSLVPHLTSLQPLLIPCELTLCCLPGHFPKYFYPLCVEITCCGRRTLDLERTNLLASITKASLGESQFLHL